VNDPTRDITSSNLAHPIRRVLLTRQDTRLVGWLETALRASDVDLMLVSSGMELERALFGAGPFDLVISSVGMEAPSGLQVLAKARTHGINTPFIIVMSFHGDFVRVMVSDVRSATLSSRMVDVTNFVSLAMSFLRPSGAPGPSRES
jgi:DNA-binding NtrC family response regulator